MSGVSEIDLSNYTTTGRLDAATAFALGTGIIAAKPHCPSPGVERAAEAVQRASASLREVWTKRETPTARIDARPADLALDNAWRTLHQRVDAYAHLPADLYPKAERAAQLEDILFPGGSLAFIQLPYEQEWSESEKRLARIDSEGLAGDLEAIAGAEFLAEIRRTHKLYGEVIGITRPAALDPTLPNLTDAIRALQKAVTNYSVQILAAYDTETEEGVAAITAALQPIVMFKAAASTARKSPEPAHSNGGTPSTPKT